MEMVELCCELEIATPWEVALERGEKKKLEAITKEPMTQEPYHWDAKRDGEEG